MNSLYDALGAIRSVALAWRRPWHRQAMGSGHLDARAMAVRLGDTLQMHQTDRLRYYFPRIFKGGVLRETLLDVLCWLDAFHLNELCEVDQRCGSMFSSEASYRQDILCGLRSLATATEPLKLPPHLEEDMPFQLNVIPPYFYGGPA